MNTYFKTIIFLLFLITHGYSQVLPIAKEIEDDGTTIYNTSLVNNYRGLIKAQGELMWTKIRGEVSFAKTFDYNIYNTCFTSLRINEKIDKKAIIMIYYFTNESGIVNAASLRNYENRILLSDAEVKCILTKAMAQKFNFTFKNGIFPFYEQISQPYKPEKQFIDPNVDPDPSNPTGDPDYK